MKKLLLLLAIFGFLGLQSFSQNVVTGKITDQNGNALPGVSVLVKETTVGSMSMNDGTYSISVPEGSNILVFSYIGMKTQEVNVTGKEVNVTMQPSDDNVITDVVVTALGITRDSKSVGYAIQEVSGADISKSQNVNVVNAISGKVAGVQIKSSTNMGGSSNVLLRGSSSLTGNNQVLFVVDGVPVNNSRANTSYQARGGSGYDYGSAVSDINPNDIQNVSVLKGAAATALYGSRAANGVIIITTKKGSKSNDGKKVTVGVNHSSMFHTMDKSTFPVYQTNYGQGYGPYYSGPLGDGLPSDYTGLYHYDFDGDGVDDYVTPTTEDASYGSHYDSGLMAYQWESFYPELSTYMQKTPYVIGANLPDYFFQRGRTLTTGVDVSGGTNVSTFRLSYTNTDQTGMMPNSSMLKNNFIFNGSFDVTDKIKFSASANYINASTKGRNHTGYSDNILSSFRQWFNLGVDMKMQEDAYNNTGKNITWNPNSENNLYPIYWDNPYFQRFESYQTDVRNRLIAYTQADWKIADGLSFMGRASIDQYSTIMEERKAVGSVSGTFGVGYADETSGYARRNISFQEINFDALLKYNKYLSDDLNVSAFVGSNSRRTSSGSIYASTSGGLTIPGLFALSNSLGSMLPPEETSSKIGVDGVFGSLSIGFKDMLFLDGTVRRDVSSTLPIDNNTYMYPSGTLSFLFSEVLDAKWLNLGKLRFNYAKIGNSAPWGSIFDTYAIQAPFGVNTLVSMSSYKNNPDLKPEISASLETGLEMSMFDNRVRIDIAAYKTNTINQVLPLAISSATGYGYAYKNIGEVENKGLETSLTLTPVRASNFAWDIRFNWAKNINKVVSLGGDIDNITLASLQGGVSINAREGEPYGTIQGTDYIYAPDGQKVIGANGYYEKTSTSDNVIGNVQPDWNAGVLNTISYKGFSMSFLIDMQMGGSIFSLDQWYGMGTGLYAETDYDNDLGNPVRNPVLDANGDELWPYFDIPGYDPTLGYDSQSGGVVLDGVVGTDTDGDGEYDTYETNLRRVSANDYRLFGWSKNPNAGFIYDASYVKLREASIGYTLPQSISDKMFFSSATFSVIGSNLWIIYKALPHADPEASQGAGNIQGWQSGVFPTAKNIGFSINLTF